MDKILFWICMILIVVMALIVLDGVLRRMWLLVIAATASIGTLVYIQFTEASWVKLGIGIVSVYACHRLWKRVFADNQRSQA